MRLRKVIAVVVVQSLKFQNINLLAYEPFTNDECWMSIFNLQMKSMEVVSCVTLEKYT